MTSTLPVGTAKIRDLTTDLVLERSVADCREIVRSHPDRFAHVTDDAPSIRERLEAMGWPAVQEFARAHHEHAERRDRATLYARLLPRIEAGEVTLPAAA